MSTALSVSGVAQRRLIHKEFRQLLPLLAILPILALVSWLLQWLFSVLLNTGRPESLDLTYQLPAIFFAVGVGGLLIADEKERRTLDWLASLPIGSSVILKCKLWAAMIGLLLVWILAGAAAIVFQSVVPVNLSYLEWGSAISLSIYVLLASIAISWRTKYFLNALFLLLLLAYLPTSLAWLVYTYGGFTNDAVHISSNQSDLTWQGLVLPMHILFALPAAYLAWRWGIEGLSATKPRPSTGFRWWTWPAATPRDCTAWRRRDVAVALAWQHLIQNRWVLLGLVLLYLAALLVGSGLMQPISTDSQGRVSQPLQLPILGCLLAVLATSWLGLTVFQSDRWDRRNQFLAERGVSPRSIFWTRHCGPLAILTGFGLVTTAALLWSLGSSGNLLIDFAPTGALIFLALLTVYAVSQWLGQSISSPVLAACLAPLIGILVFLYFWLSISLIGAPWWLMLGPPALMMAYSAWRMLLWLEQRQSRWAFMHQILLGSSLIFLPWLPLFWLSITLPGLSASTSSEMDRLLDSVAMPKPGERAQYVSLFSESLPESTQSRPEAGRVLPRGQSGRFLTLADAEQAIDRVFEQLSAQTGLVDGINNETNVLFSMANLAADRALFHEEAVSRRLYNKSLNVVLLVAKRSRVGHSFYQLNGLDELEIWLLRQMLDESRASLIDDSVYNSIVDLLQDAEGRKVARRKTLVQTWELQNQRYRGLFAARFGRHYRNLTTLESIDFESNLCQRLRDIRRMELSLDHLWRLSTGPAAATPELLRQLAEDMQTLPDVYGQGALGSFFRPDDARDLLPVDSQYERPMGYMWSAGWERQAAALSRRPQ